MTFEESARRVLDHLVAHYGPQHWWEDGETVKDWVTMILIQQATAQNVERALANLAPYLTFERLNQLTSDELNELVRPAGFYKQKTRSIQAMLAWWRTYHNDVSAFQSISTPDLRRSLISVRGIGPETADVMLLYIFERRVFIADQYALRLFKRLGLGDFANYAALSVATEPLLVEPDWVTVREWHAVIDEHGKQYRKRPDMDETWLLN
ncbi:endonuclease III domain-containing protein [Secundilactobacillus kimchicus]|uniref:endonuclease III domain-containing protein n=1 Tax=Secundilactobacillus kimchicus TaxID=528209 RepID=UPI0024A9989C|nr:endonuclease III domain-containing protein [Secundilactobacillus kimchicus]